MADDIFIEEAGVFDTSKIDINEITQYSILEEYIKLSLGGNGPVIKGLLPPDSYEALNGDPYEYAGIYTIVSENQKNSESTNEIINYLLSRKYSDKLLDLTSKDISSLLSYVKFFRIPKEGNKPLFDKATEIAFSTHYSKQSLSSFLQDNTAVGIKSAMIDVISNTGAYYNYQISIDLFFANSNVLMNDENYKALLTTPTKDPNKEPIVYCLVFGWVNNGLNDKIKDLCDQQTCLLLYIKNYNLEFNMDGSVSLKVNFIGAAENEKEAGNTANMMYRDSDIKSFFKQFENEYNEYARVYSEAKDRYTKRYNQYMQLIDSKKALILNENPQANYEDDSEIKAIKAEMENTSPKAIDDAKRFGGETIYLFNEKAVMERAEKQLNRIKQTTTNFKYGRFLEELSSKAQGYIGETELWYYKDLHEKYEKSSEITFKPRFALRRFDPSTDIKDREFSDLRRDIQILKTLDKEKEQGIIDKRKKEIINSNVYGSLNPNYELINKDGYKFRLYATYGFRYYLLGDIISLAYSITRSNSVTTVSDKEAVEEDDFKILLGTIDINIEEDYVSDKFKDGQGKDAFENKYAPLAEEGVISDGKYYGEKKQILTLDLANFPIPYNLFVAWWLKNVVEPGVEVYSLNNFIKNFINDCVLGSIKLHSSNSEKYYNRTNAKRTLRKKVISAYKDETITTTYIDLPYDLREVSEGSFNAISTSKIKESFYDAKKVKINPFVRNGIPDRNIKKYAIIHGQFGNLSHNSDYESNLQSGIFHFYVGASTGILKDIKFIPLTGPYVGEAQILSADKQTKQTPLSEKFNLIQRFDVNITCIGFHYFKPGQLIYVDTSLVGFGKTTDLNSPARRFTLGGYYIITKTTHNIENNEFRTSLTAKFHDYGS